MNYFLIFCLGLTIAQQNANDAIDLETVISANNQLTAAEIQALLEGNSDIDLRTINLPSFDLSASLSGSQTT